MSTWWYRWSPVIAGLALVFIASTTVAWYWTAP